MLQKNRLLSVFILIIFLIPFCNTALASNSSNQNISNLSIIPDLKVIQKIVKKGDTASKLLNSYLPLKTIYEISRQSSDVYSVTRIRRGQPYKIILQEDHLVGFKYEIDKEDQLVILKEDYGFSVAKLPIEYDVYSEVVSGSIKYSLFEAVRRAGEQTELAIKLSDIFAWDIDFIKDIRPGDQFKVLVEKKYRDGKLCGYGKIEAAFFTNKNSLYKAFLHKDSRGIYGYYDEMGRSLQKTFLKAPLSFSRISSKFTKKRMHPILKVYKAHNGVDYAAPKGTPIKSVGDGSILEMGYNKGMGNYIKIRHYNGYLTSYFHMTKFAKGMKRKKRLVQGDIIGYVGKTGLATGYHLCYRMIKNGKLIDPLKHKSPSANPVKPDEMDQFLSRSQHLSTQIMTTQELAKLESL